MKTIAVILLILLARRTVDAQSQVIVYSKNDSAFIDKNNKDGVEQKKTKDVTAESSHLRSLPPGEENYIYFGCGRSLGEEIERVLCFMKERNGGHISKMSTNSVSVVLPTQVRQRACHKNGYIGFPSNEFDDVDNLNGILKELVESRLWGELYLLEAWNMFYVCCSSHQEVKRIIALHGKVCYASGKSVKQLEVQGIKGTGHMRQATTTVDETGRYLSVIEMLLVAYNYRMDDEHYGCITTKGDISAVSWKIDGELIHETPLTNVVYDSLMQVDILPE